MLGLIMIIIGLIFRVGCGVGNNRLDFIKHIEDDAIEMMEDIRAMFINLDEKIVDFEEAYPDISNGQNYAAARAASLARTHLEIALQFTIKALCLCGEMKE